MTLVLFHHLFSFILLRQKSFYRSRDGLELSMETRLSLNFRMSFCLSLLSTNITDMHHHALLTPILYKINKFVKISRKVFLKVYRDTQIYVGESGCELTVWPWRWHAVPPGYVGCQHNPVIDWTSKSQCLWQTLWTAAGWGQTLSPLLAYCCSPYSLLSQWRAKGILFTMLKKLDQGFCAVVIYFFLGVSDGNRMCLVWVNSCWGL